MASNGTLSSTIGTSNGGDAYAKATLTWTSEDSLSWKDVYLNDRCNVKARTRS